MSPPSVTQRVQGKARRNFGGVLGESNWKGRKENQSEDLFRGTGWERQSGDPPLLVKQGKGDTEHPQRKEGAQYFPN